MNPEPLVQVRNLAIATDAGAPILRGASLSIPAGRTFALMGESGSGKTTLALALLGHLRSGLHHTAGTVTVAGRDVLALRKPALRAYRRSTVAWLPQDPLLALTPHLSVREILAEIAPRSDAELLRLLADVGLDANSSLLDRLPREFSGGQRRRVAIARALVAGPRLVVLDEPTAGLDADAVEDVLRVLRAEPDLAVLLITHDLGVAERFADIIAVMDEGRIIETVDRSTLRRSSRTGLTERLIGAYDLRIVAETASATLDRDVALEVRHLDVQTPTGVPVVHGLDLTLRRGEGTAIVGPSGVGKSTLVRALVGAITPQSGAITLTLTGNDGQQVREVLAPAMTDRTPAQRRAVQVISQDPAGGLNPALTIGTQLRRAIRRAHPTISRQQTDLRIRELLDSVRLSEALLGRRPLSLSGGQAQRVAIARALAHRPTVLICDETTSALDPVVQQSVLDTLNEVRRDHGIALLLVTHSPQVAAYATERTLTLDRGSHTLTPTPRPIGRTTHELHT